MATKLAIEQVRVRLRMKRRTRFHFFHGGAVMGLLCDALGMHDLPRGLVPVVCEMGRVEVGAGDRYHLGFVLAGSARFLARRLELGLQRVGARPAKGSGPRRTFGSGFEVECFERIGPPELAPRWGADAESGTVDLRWVSPFRLQRPEQDQIPHRTYLNQRCFSPHHFLRKLWGRLQVGRNMPPLPEEIHAVTQGLHWLDVPIQRAPGREPFTLGGVVGGVRLLRVPESWRPLLALGALVHTGRKLHYGFGRYQIGGPGSSAFFAPAVPLLDRARELDLASEIAEPGWRRLGVTGLRGRLNPALSTGSGGDGGAPGEPDPSDEAVATVLAPSCDRLLEDCSAAYKLGVSPERGETPLRNAAKEGSRHLLEVDLVELLEQVGWQYVDNRLEALFPGEGLGAWLARRRTQASRVSEPLAAVLVKLCIEKVALMAQRLDLRVGLSEGEIVFLGRPRRQRPAAPAAAAEPTIAVQAVSDLTDRRRWSRGREAM